MNTIYGYTMNSPLIQPFPWNVEEHYYVVPADRHLVFHYFKENKQVIVSQPSSIQSVQRWKDTLFVLLESLQLRVY